MLIEQEHRASVQNAIPRLGFAGVGWIGRHRMSALLEQDLCEAVAIAEPDPRSVEAARQIAPDVAVLGTFEALLDRDDLDGVVIATPSAAHAQQCMAALERGLSVFCQKPLGRNAQEAAAVLAAAQKADRLLGVDLSYRHTAAMTEISKAIRAGAIGDVFAIDLTFHNAYGPDKPWFYDKALSGGGCVIDLGVHLVDLALWVMGFPQAEVIQTNLYSGGRRMTDADGVEDYAVATILLGTDTTVRLACSWNLHAGKEAEIAARFYGTAGGMQMRNINGSFYDFTAEALNGTTLQTLTTPPDAWGGGAIRSWARQWRHSPRFDTEALDLVRVSYALDAIYAAA